MNTANLVALVSLPNRANYRHVPIALMCLASWLDKEGISNTIIDVKINRDPYVPMRTTDIERVTKEILAQVKETKPRFVGLPCYTADYPAVMALAKEIKNQCGATTIAGGHHATLKPEDFLYENSPIDFVVIGEGEITLSELVRASLHELPLKEVPGIAYRGGGGIVTTRPRGRIADLTSLPQPAYHKIDMEYYLQPTRYLVRSLLLSGVHILTSRGCPSLCTFCANRKREVTFRAPKDVVEEIKFLRGRYGIDSFYIVDDTFCLRKERVLEFSSLVRELPFKLAWAMETTVKSVDEDMIKALRKAGCIQIDFGVESGSQSALDRMRKGTTVEQVESVFRSCRRLRMRTFANFMFNTPEETEDDVRRTINLMKRIKATNYGIHLTVPYVGTEIYEKYVVPKLIKEEYQVYANPALYHTILDKRFLLARHNLDLDRLYVVTLLRFIFLRKTLDLLPNGTFWRSLVNSKRRITYVLFLLSGYKRQARVCGYYLARLISAFGRRSKDDREGPQPGVRAETSKTSEILT